MAATLPSMLLSRVFGADFLQNPYLGEPLEEGPFKPTWTSLQNYKTPDWYRKATAMGWPEDGKLVVKSLARNSIHFPKKIQRVEWLPTKQSLAFERNENGLIISSPEKTSDESTYANVVRIFS
jgi:alpha-L-fucosidase